MAQSIRQLACVECGAIFQYGGSGQPAKTCGEECRRRRHRRWQPKARQYAPKAKEEIPCARCAVMFEPPRSRGRYLYCSMCQNCGLEGCDRPREQGNWCSMHSRRIYRQGDPGPSHRLPNNPKAGQGFLHEGYRMFNIKGRNIPEHRMVMERVLDRPLEPFENIHHRNGQRADNRPENLELWVTMQPSGQRPEDLVNWVVEHYPQLVREALDKESPNG